MDDLLGELTAETRGTLEGISGEIVARETDLANRARASTRSVASSISLKEVAASLISHGSPE
jgi:hypothetical protein